MSATPTGGPGSRDWTDPADTPDTPDPDRDRPGRARRALNLAWNHKKKLLAVLAAGGVAYAGYKFTHPTIDATCTKTWDANAQGFQVNCDNALGGETLQRQSITVNVAAAASDGKRRICPGVVLNYPQGDAAKRKQTLPPQKVECVPAP